MEFRVLGTLEVVGDEGALPLGGPKQRAVVAHLILRAGHAVPAEQLIDELWGEEPPETARNTLQTYVYRLRKVLGEDRLEGQSGAYVLHAEPDEIDAARFEALVRQGRAQMPSDPAGALARLDDALGLWRGPAFADFPDEPSLRGEVSRLEELRLAATEHRVAAQLALGRHTTVVGTLEVLTDRYPLRERLWASLMLALYRSGRQAEALDAYRRAREVLADELGIDPSRELQELHERILRQDPDLVATATPALDAPSAPSGPRTVAGDLGPGTVYAGYRIESVLGRGGMSVVYLAEHLGLERKVALKILAPQLAEDERFHDRFVRESRIAAGMEHPAIVPIYEAGESEGLLFIAMRYVPGIDLNRLIRREGTLDPERTAWIVGEVASALDAAHGRGLVHRDVKPGNILIVEGDGRDGRDLVYLSDFGLTKRLEGGTGGLTQTGQFVGTVEFVAPEQIEGRTVDGRADVYSLACVAVECLTGRPPFARDAQVATLYAHLRERPPSVTVARPELPAVTDRVLAKALAKAPSDRYPTCGAFAGALREGLGPLAGEAVSGTDAASAGGRRWWWTAAVALAAAAIAGVVAFTLADGSPPPAEGAAPSSPTSPAAPSASPTPQRFVTVERALTADEERLQSYLPAALGPCLPLDQDDATRGELASLVCRDDPVEVLYQLFPRPDLMDATFQTGVNIVGAPAGECAVEHEAVSTYTVDREPSGRVLCFLRGSGPDDEIGEGTTSHLTWTDERLLVFADAIRNDGGDLSLFRWWLEAGPNVPESDGSTQHKDVPAGTTKPIPDGTYLAHSGPNDASHDPQTDAMRVWAGTYAYAYNAQETETGTVSFRKPGTVIFSPVTGFCANERHADTRPAAFGWTVRGDTVTWRYRGGGDCAGPQPPMASRPWVLAPAGALAIESTGLIATIEPGGFGLRELDVASTTRRNWIPSWSPDGEHIVYVGSAEDAGLYVMDADGTNVRRLIDEPGDEFWPEWSPDGSRIAYVKVDGDPIHWTNTVTTLAVDGSDQRTLFTVRDENLYLPSWSPDGERLTFGVQHGDETARGSGVYVMDADGGEPIEIYRGTGIPPAPAFTPDGRRIVFWGRHDGKPMLLSIRPDGTGLQVFLRHTPELPLAGFVTATAGAAQVLGVGWSPNGRWVVVSQPTDFGGGIWLLRTNGSDPYFVAWQSGWSWRSAPPAVPSA